MRYKQDNNPVTVIKDKNNSLLIIKLHSGTVARGTVTGGVESSVDFNETFSFCAEADLFTTFSVTFVAALLVKENPHLGYIHLNKDKIA